MILLLKAPNLKKKPNQLTLLNSSLDVLENYLSRLIIDGSDLEFYNQTMKENTSSKEALAKSLHLKKPEDALKKMYYILGKVEILWSKMVDLELLTIVKYKKAHKHKKYPPINHHTLTQAFSSRIETYINIINIINIINSTEPDNVRMLYQNKENEKSTTEIAKEEEKLKIVELEFISEFPINSRNDITKLMKEKLKDLVAENIRNQIDKILQKMSNDLQANKNKVQELNKIIDTHSKSIEQSNQLQESILKMKEQIQSAKNQIKQKDLELVEVKHKNQLLELELKKQKKSIAIQTSTESKEQGVWVDTYSDEIQTVKKQFSDFKILTKETQDEKKKKMYQELEHDIRVSFEVMYKNSIQSLTKEIESLKKKLQMVENKEFQLQREISDFRQEIQSKDAQIELVESTLKKKLKKNSNDDTFEAVLRQEMMIMKNAYDAKITKLNDTIMSLKSDSANKIRDGEIKLIEMKTNNECLFRRIQELLEKNEKLKELEYK